MHKDNKEYDQLKKTESELHTLIQKYKTFEESYMDILETDISQYINRLVKVIHKDNTEELFYMNKFGYKRDFHVGYNDIHSSCKADKFKLIDLTTPEGEKEYTRFTTLQDEKHSLIRSGKPILMEPCQLENRNVKNRDMNVYGIVTEDGTLRRYPTSKHIVEQIKPTCPKNDAIELSSTEIHNMIEGPELSIQHDCTHVKMNDHEHELQILRTQIEDKAKQFFDMLENINKQQENKLEQKEYQKMKQDLQRDLKSMDTLQEKKRILKRKVKSNDGAKELSELHTILEWENMMKWSGISIVILVVVIGLLKRYA